MPRSLQHQLESFQALYSWWRKESALNVTQRKFTQRDIDARNHEYDEVNATLQFMVRNEDLIRAAVKASRVDGASGDG